MELHEIRLHVGSFLDYHDLCSCIRVSKLWHESFLPFIYAEAKSEVLHEHWSSFSSHLSQVRNLAITQLTEPKEREAILANCQRLVRLNFQSENPWGTMGYLIQLLQRNPQLVQVALTFEGSDDPTLWKTLVNDCPKLTEIEIYVTYFQGKCLTGFMTLASRLTNLDLSGCNVSQLLEWMSPSSTSPVKHQSNYILDDIPDDISDDMSDHISDDMSDLAISDNDNDNGSSSSSGAFWEGDWSGFPVLRILSISGMYDDNDDGADRGWETQLEMFVRAPQLEILSWNIVDLQYSSSSQNSSGEFIPTLVRLLRQRTWPRLNSLEITEDDLGRQSTLNDERLAEILTLLPDGLKSFRIPGATFGLLSWQAVQRHVGTLQVLQLTEISSWMVQGLLTSCPELRELKGPVLNTSDLVRGVQEDLVRQENAVAAAEMLAKEGLPEELMTRLFPRKHTARVADPNGASGSSITKGLDEGNITKEGDPLSVPMVLEDPFPRPWVCHRLKVLHVTLRSDTKEKSEKTTEASSQVFEQLKKMRYLQELYLCPLENAKKFDGLNPRPMLGEYFAPPDFRGEFTSTAKIRKHHVGERLLEIWPGLKSCCWHKDSTKK